MLIKGTPERASRLASSSLEDMADIVPFYLFFFYLRVDLIDLSRLVIPEHARLLKSRSEVFNVAAGPAGY